MKKGSIFIAFLFFAIFLRAEIFDPNKTATIYVHGFNNNGYKREATYGEDKYEEFFNSIPSFIGLPTTNRVEDKNKPNVVESNVFSFFTTSYNPYTKTVWNLKLEKEKGNYVLYIIDLKEKAIYKRLVNIDEDIKILGFFFPDSKNKYFVDDNYDIYKLSMEESYEKKN